MELSERIGKLRRQAGLTVDELAERSGVAKGTLNKITGGVTKNPTVSVARDIARALGVTLGELLGEDSAAMSADALDLARDFESLDGHGRRVLLSVAAEEKRRMEAETAEAAPAAKIIPLFGASFAAGLGEPDFGNAWEDYAVPADSKADFAIRINGDSMEPYLPDGSIALGQKRAPRDGEVAALLLDGEFLCKQVCQDFVGNLYLFSLNRARKDADRTIAHDAGRRLDCFGTILMERVPLPTDV